MSAVEYNLETPVDQPEGGEVADAEYDDNLHLWHNKQEPWATLPSGWSYPIQSDNFSALGNRRVCPRWREDHQDENRRRDFGFHRAGAIRR